MQIQLNAWKTEDRRALALPYFLRSTTRNLVSRSPQTSEKGADRVKQTERTTNSVPYCTGLSRQAAARDGTIDIKLVGNTRNRKRPVNHHT